MTLQELQALTDEQLIEKVAVEVVGWTKSPYTWTYTDGGNVVPCKSCGSTEHSGHNYKWLLVCDKCQVEEEVERSGWNPLTDSNHAKAILDRMRNHWGCTYNIRLLANGKTSVEFIDNHGMIAGQCRHKDHLRAICLAALLAIQS